MPQEFTALLLSLMHFAGASVVSVHALLSKRDVGATVGWIGLAWLSPIGSLLYLILGINRVRRRARRLRRPYILTPAPPAGLPADIAAGLHSLATAVNRITARPLQPGNAIEPLQNGDEAYPRMLQAIARAEFSIALSSYIFRADATGHSFIEALAAAQARGVEVRVLLDGIGSGYFISPATRALEEAAIPTAQFLHSRLPWRMPFLNMRTHKKILVVDGREGFTGGLNIGSENLAATPAEQRVRDVHFWITGPVVAQLVDTFAEDWLFATGEALAGGAWAPRHAPCGPAVMRAITSGPDQDLEKLELVLLAAIGAARRSIRVVTPYFLPDERICSALEIAALSGVAVDIVLPGTNDHRIMDWAVRAHIRPLLQAGCRIWRSPPPFDHSKLMTVDSAWALVGSANWDARSLRLNFELNIEVYDSDYAIALDGMIAAKLHQPVTLAELDGRSLPVALRDAAARLLLPYL